MSESRLIVSIPGSAGLTPDRWPAELPADQTEEVETPMGYKAQALAVHGEKTRDPLMWIRYMTGPLAGRHLWIPARLLSIVTKPLREDTTLL